MLLDTIVGITLTPLVTIFSTNPALSLTISISTDEPVTKEVYWFVSVTLMFELTLFTNVGNEPVPFAMISFICVNEPVVVANWLEISYVPLTFTYEPEVIFCGLSNSEVWKCLAIVNGILSEPNLIISVIILILADTIPTWVSPPLNEDVVWVAFVTFINESILLTSYGNVLIELPSVLLNVWSDWGKCFTAPEDADTNVWTDCGKCFTASLDADTNVCIEPEALPAFPTLIVNVPFCLSNPLDTADTNVCGVSYDEEPILISNEFVVTFEISNHLPLGKSVPALGYDLPTTFPSNKQLNVNELSESLI